MRLNDKITMTNEQLGPLGREALDVYVRGLDSGDHLVIAAYLGTLMYMTLENILQNTDLKIANGVLESISVQWERNHAAD